MLRRILRCLLFVPILLAMMSAGPVAAGPWPRAQGEGFLSFGLNRHGTGQGYLEYGLAPRLVLSLGAEHGTGNGTGNGTGDGRQTRRLDAALRWHPPDTASGIVSGLSLGVRHLSADPVRTRLTLGADVGRGFDTAAGNAWLRAGAQLLLGRGQTGLRAEWDLTAQAGLRRGAGLVLLGVSQYRNSFGNDTRIRPALGYEVSPRLTVVGEAAVTPAGRRAGLNLSVWSRF